MYCEAATMPWGQRSKPSNGSSPPTAVSIMRSALTLEQALSTSLYLLLVLVQRMKFITVPLTFIATVAVIGQTGARVRFVDVDPVSYTMNPALIANEITHRTKAIVPVHLYGQPADMDPILAIARRHGIAVIEDAAQAHGATYKNRMVGGLGDLGCFSFYPGKNLGACGEGGMIVTQDPERARIARMLRDWGQESQYHHVLKGGNYRLDGVQGAILRVKLQHLDKWNRKPPCNCGNLHRPPDRLWRAYSCRDGLCTARLPRVRRSYRSA